MAWRRRDEFSRALKGDLRVVERNRVDPVGPLPAAAGGTRGDEDQDNDSKAVAKRDHFPSATRTFPRRWREDGKACYAMAHRSVNPGEPSA